MDPYGYPITQSLIMAIMVVTPYAFVTFHLPRVRTRGLTISQLLIQTLDHLAYDSTLFQYFTPNVTFYADLTHGIIMQCRHHLRFYDAQGSPIHPETPAALINALPVRVVVWAH